MSYERFQMTAVFPSPETNRCQMHMSSMAAVSTPLVTAGTQLNTLNTCITMYRAMVTKNLRSNSVGIATRDGSGRETGHILTFIFLANSLADV